MPRLPPHDSPTGRVFGDGLGGGSSYNGPGPGSGVPISRKRQFTGDAYTRRKRAATACQFCRIRKTKCDNVRPTCGYCQHHKAKCVYGDEEGEETTTAPTSEDANHQEIIDRLDELKSMLSSSIAPVRPSQATFPASLAPITPAPGPEPGLPPPLPPPPARINGRARTHTDGLLTAFATARCESLLKWPVFDGIIAREDRQISSFLFSSGDDAASLHRQQSSAFSETPRSGEAYNRGIEEDSLLPLCRKFLAYVHPRNPILDAEELLGYAKAAAENGLRWDAPSCLVLLACALALFTRPWQQPNEMSDIYDESRLDSPPPEEVALAKAYYLAARKRIGLLEASIIDIQCLFFASVFEKFMLRPMQAWFYIQQAATRLQMLQLRRGREPCAAPSPAESPGSELEQRLFWSCFRAESELIPVIPLQPSGLDDFKLPDMFPSPPTYDQPSPELQGQDRADEERGWFFYLAEIALRRTINDTVWLLYRKGEDHWLKNIDQLLEQHAESEQQISLWHYHVPPSIRFDAASPPAHELPFYLQTRFDEWREHTLRPFLYYALHRPSASPPLSPSVRALAQEEVALCATAVLRDAHHQRHGGTWFILRNVFACAVLLLAVVADPRGELRPPEDWMRVLGLARGIIGRWGPEAEDVARMGRVLERLYRGVCARKGFAG